MSSNTVPSDPSSQGAEPLSCASERERSRMPGARGGRSLGGLHGGETTTSTQLSCQKKCTYMLSTTYAHLHITGQPSGRNEPIGAWGATPAAHKLLARTAIRDTMPDQAQGQGTWHRAQGRRRTRAVQAVGQDGRQEHGQRQALGAAALRRLHNLRHARAHVQRRRRPADRRAGIPAAAPPHGVWCARCRRRRRCQPAARAPRPCPPRCGSWFRHLCNQKHTAGSSQPRAAYAGGHHRLQHRLQAVSWKL